MMKRLDKLREAMKEAGVDSVLVFNNYNQRYLSEFAFSDGFLFVTLTKAYLITDFRYYEMALASANKDFEVTMTKDRKSFISEKIAECGVKTVGFEGGFLSYETYKHYAETY